MTWFSARNISLSLVPVPPDKIWAVITHPATLASLTPLVRSIESSGEHWRWTLNGIDGLGVTIEPVFTERMNFTDERQIVFSHEPPTGASERAAVEGVYDLLSVENGSTELRVDLTLSVELPLPRLSRLAVERIMYQTMRLTGQKFASNLYEHLGLDPRDVTIEELSPPEA